MALLPLGRLADVDDASRRPAGRASTSCGVTSLDLGAGLAEEVGVGLRHGWWWLRWSTGCRWCGAGRGGRIAADGSRLGGRLRPAGDTCSGARSGRVMRGAHARASPARGRRSAAPSLGRAPCWSVSWLSIAHFRRAGLISMPSRSSRSSARKAATSATGLPLISSVRSDALAWLIAQPRPVNPTRSTTPSVDAELQRDPVAAQRVGALVGRVGVLDDPEVVGPPVVLEDVVAVEVVHGCASTVARAANSDQIVGDWMSPGVRRRLRAPEGHPNRSGGGCAKRRHESGPPSARDAP